MFDDVVLPLYSAARCTWRPPTASPLNTRTRSTDRDGGAYCSQACRRVIASRRGLPASFRGKVPNGIPVASRACVHALFISVLQPVHVHMPVSPVPDTPRESGEPTTTINALADQPERLPQIRQQSFALYNLPPSGIGLPDKHKEVAESLILLPICVPLNNPRKPMVDSSAKPPGLLHLTSTPDSEDVLHRAGAGLLGLERCDAETEADSPELRYLSRCVLYSQQPGFLRPVGCLAVGGARICDHRDRPIDNPLAAPLRSVFPAPTAGTGVKANCSEKAAFFLTEARKQN
ncbi:hypothetical protein MRX96_030708 [Rhipicephalus microplus]